MRGAWHAWVGNEWALATWQRARAREGSARASVREHVLVRRGGRAARLASVLLAVPGGGERGLGRRESLHAEAGRTRAYDQARGHGAREHERARARTSEGVHECTGAWPRERADRGRWSVCGVGWGIEVGAGGGRSSARDFRARSRALVQTRSPALTLWWYCTWHMLHTASAPGAAAAATRTATAAAAEVERAMSARLAGAGCVGGRVRACVRACVRVAPIGLPLRSPGCAPFPPPPPLSPALAGARVCAPAPGSPRDVAAVANS